MDSFKSFLILQFSTEHEKFLVNNSSWWIMFIGLSFSYVFPGKMSMFHHFFHGKRSPFCKNKSPYVTISHLWIPTRHERQTFGANGRGGRNGRIGRRRWRLGRWLLLQAAAPGAGESALVDALGRLGTDWLGEKCGFRTTNSKEKLRWEVKNNRCVLVFVFFLYCSF